MSWWEILKQNLWLLYLVLGLLGAISGVIILKRFWSEKIYPCLYSLYETVKSKIPKRDEEMTKEELKQIANE